MSFESFNEKTPDFDEMEPLLANISGLFSLHNNVIEATRKLSMNEFGLIDDHAFIALAAGLPERLKLSSDVVFELNS